MAVTSENARGLPQESTESDVSNEDLASECGGDDGGGLCGYVEEGLEARVDVEGCFDRESAIKSWCCWTVVLTCADNIVLVDLSEPRFGVEFGGWCPAAGGL